MAIPVTITQFAAYDNTADKVGREADFWSQCHLEPSGPAQLIALWCIDAFEAIARAVDFNCVTLDHARNIP